MSSQGDLHTRFSDLLQPIRDLTRNWDVDVASQLEDYIEEIAHITISFDDGVTKMNFAEAALLIQGSTCVFSRKVEYLHALVYQTLDLVASKRKQGQSNQTNQDLDPEMSFAQRVEDDQFLSLDDIPMATNIDMDEQSVSKSASTIPRTPISLVPLMDYEKTNSIPLYSKEGELIGSHLDFKMNTSIIHESGALLLEPLGHMVLEVELSGGRAFTIDKHTPAHKINALLPPLPFASPSLHNTPCFDAQDDDHMDISIDNDAGFDHTPSPHEQSRPVTRQRVKIADQAKENDPWALLDPHDPGTETNNKPFKKGVTFRLPKTLEDKKKRKRKQFAVKTIEPLAEFIRRSFYSCSSQFPKNPLKTPLSSEFEGHYWAEQQRRQQQKKRENLTLKRLHKEAVVDLEEVVRREDPGDEDSLDGYLPLGDDGPAGDADDDLEAGFEEAFEGFNPSEGHVNNPFLGVEPMALDDSKDGCHGNPKVVQTYEDLVRNYVESTMMGVVTYSQQTDLSRRVQEWEERIKPQLQAEEHSPVFDIHQYGINVIHHFKTDTEQSRDKIYFCEIGGSKKVSDICRLFAATLQLANDGNVLIETKDSGGEQEVDSMKLTLLSTEMAHKAVSNYTAPSLKAH